MIQGSWPSWNRPGRFGKFLQMQDWSISLSSSCQADRKNIYGSLCFKSGRINYEFCKVFYPMRVAEPASSGTYQTGLAAAKPARPVSEPTRPVCLAMCLPKTCENRPSQFV